MSKFKVEVTNIGNRMRERLGSRIHPNDKIELEVNNKQHITLKAVKDFKVVKLDNDKDGENEDTEEKQEVEGETSSKEEQSEKEQETDDSEQQDVNHITGIQDKINESNIEQVLSIVEDGELSIDEAIAYETVGKNRPTLIEKLEQKKQDD